MAKKQLKQKHIPMRMCIVTGEKKPKAELMRLVRVNDEVKVDPKGKERGRGANITMDEKIFGAAVKKHSIERALKLKKNLTKEQVEKLKKDFIEGIELKKFRKGSQPVVVKVKKEEIEKVLEK